jgi:O-acetyl-ADP-ribose deacetylase (regulator of RNase III)
VVLSWLTREASAVIHEERGNLLAADADALVNTVNTVGVAGKGIALQFRQAYPDNFRAYAQAAKRGEVVPGQMFTWETGQLGRPRLIINFPTKRHWRGSSRLEDIRRGLRSLVGVIEAYGLSSIAVPPLGCGNGGLDWADVRPLIVDALGSLSVEVLLYPPVGAPSADEVPVRSAPRMTLGRASLLMLIKQYRETDWFRLSALEIQKLAYFLQESGEPLRLEYTKAPCGPYAQNLNHVLIQMEGDYTRGYGDQTSGPEIHVLDGAYASAEAYLSGHTQSLQRLDRVAKLLDDWETPYGLELLATVHWALTRPEPALQSNNQVQSFVAAWTPRKAKLFKPRQVDRAITHLVDQGYAKPLRMAEESAE